MSDVPRTETVNDWRVSAMTTSEKTNQVCLALLKAQEAFSKVFKSAENRFDKYKYATLGDYWDATADALQEAGLALISHVAGIETLPDRGTQAGKTERAVRVYLDIRLVHTADQWIQCRAVGEGQDRADKAIYKALTGARKYGIAAMLNLATTDDPEQDSDGRYDEPPANGKTARPAGVPTAAPPVKSVAITEEQSKRLWAMIGARGISEDAVKALYAELGIPETRAIPIDMYSIVFAKVEALAKKGGA